MEAQVLDDAVQDGSNLSFGLVINWMVGTSTSPKVRAPNACTRSNRDTSAPLWQATSLPE